MNIFSKKIKKLLCIFFAVIMATLFLSCKEEEKEQTKFYAFPSWEASLYSVEDSSFDVAVVDSIYANYYVYTLNHNDLTVLSGEDFIFEKEQYRIATKKGSNVDDYINAGLYKFQQENVSVNYTNNNGNVSCNLAYVADDFGLKSNLITIAEPSVKTDTAPALGSDFERILNDGFNIGIVTEGFTREINNQPFAGNSHLAGDNGFEILICRALGAIYNKKVDTTSTQIIDLASGKAALDNGTIDLLIGGRSAKSWGDGLDFSVPYISNRQVIVIRTADKDKYSSYEKMKSAKFTAAENSEGETLLKGEINKKVFGN